MSIHEIRNFMRSSITIQLNKFIISDLSNIVGNYIACKYDPGNKFSRCSHRNIFCGLNRPKRVKINGYFHVRKKYFYGYIY